MRSAKQIMADVKAQHEHDVDPTPPWPEPEVRMRPVAISDPLVPRAAVKLAQAGAAYRLTYSRGPTAARGGYKIVDALAVRVIAGQRKLIAVYHDGKFRVAFGHGVNGRLGAKAALAYLTEDDVDLEWLPDYAWLPRH